MRLIEKSIARSGTSGLTRKNNARNRSGIWIKTLIIEIAKFLHPIGIFPLRTNVFPELGARQHPRNLGAAALIAGHHRDQTAVVFDVPFGDG